MTMDLRCPDQACRNFLVKNFNGIGGDFRCSKCGMTVRILVKARHALLTTM